MARGRRADRVRAVLRRAPRALAIVLAACSGGASGPAPSPTPTVVDAAAIRSAGEPLLARAREVLTKVRATEPERALREIGPSRRNGAIYRFDERIDEATVEGSAPVAEGARAAPVAGFELEGGDPVDLVSHRGQAQAKDGRLAWHYRRPDYLISRGDLAVPSDAVATIELRVRAEGVKRLEVFWSHAAFTEWSRESRRRGGSIAIDLVPDGEFHTYRVDATTALRRGANVGGAIRTLVVRVMEEDAAEVEIDHLRFLPHREKYAHRTAGRGYETFDREMRSVAFSHAPATLVYEVAIPAAAPTLEFGTAVLDDGAAADLSVEVETPAGRTEVHSERRTSGRHWRDAKVDLSRWAGERVRIRFAARAEPATVVFWSNPAVYGAPPERFNVIVILEDTLRADRLSLYGHELETSPVKDRLAEDGVVFENVFSQATETRPSVPSLMTSLYPTATGVWNFHEVLDGRYVTLAEILRSQGFETASFAQNPNGGPAAGLHQGFSFHRDHATLGRRAHALYGGEHVAAWLRAHGHRNFALYLHLVDPHGRYDPPKPYDRFFREHGPGKTAVEADRLASDPAWVETPTLEGRRLLYDGEVLYNDASLAELLRLLDELKLREHTLIVFLADHGEHLGEHGLWSHHPPGYVQVLHVPLLMVHPETLPRGVRVAAPVELVDVVPTILDLAGIDASALPLQGDSLVSLARGEPSAAGSLALSEEVIAYRSKEDAAVWGSVFLSDRHFLKSEGVAGVVGFARRTDPDESDPIALEPAVATEVTDLISGMKTANLAIWRALTRDAERTITLDPERQERLRALGYLR
jgi:arylsulfatase A-like enzyme